MTVPDLIWSGGIGALAGAIVALVTTVLNNRGQPLNRQLPRGANSGR
jgi:hypothetical protein